MKYSIPVLILALTLILVIGSAGYGAEEKLPAIKGKKIVALVNEEPITLEDFNQERSSLEPRDTESQKTDNRTSDSELLRRLINTRLIIQEARKIGLDELPEVKNMVDVFSRVTLRELLTERQLKDVKTDAKEAERLYKESVKEWKIKSVVFEKEDEAKKMEEEIRAGGNFVEIVKKRIADGTAKGGEGKDYVKPKDLHPQIAGVISKMEVGSISPVIPLMKDFLVLHLQDVRFPENPETREKARLQALNLKKAESLKKFNDGLIKKYAKVHKEIVDRLDFESKEPGFQKMLKDTRVVAEIKGEKPITVGELTEYLRQQLYHGMEMASESKKLNSKIIPAMDEMLYKRVFRKEAIRLGIDKTGVFKNRLKEYENSVVFGAFIQKAVVPDVKLREEEVKSYYDGHVKEYTYPEMMNANSLIFGKRADAENAIEKLRKGTELRWLAENAEGQVDKNTQELLTFEGKFLATKGLPQGLQKVIEGARPGDFKLYASPEGHFYVLSIQEIIPAKPQPYEEVRQAISKKVFDDKLKKAVEDWANKLRAVSDVKVYLKDN